MIKITSSNVESLSKKALEATTKNVKFIQKQGDKIVGMKGYLFGTDSVKTRELVADKIKKAIELPKNCGEIFVLLA